jgi:DNA-binding MarR family transcriptional regulator
MKYHRVHAMGTSRTPRKKQPAGASPEPAARVLRRFRIVFNAVKGHFRSVERKAGISGAQVWALSVVRAHPGIGVSELARAMDVHQSTASNLLRTLTDAGLVASARAGTDRRAVQLRHTPEGQKILKKAPGPFTGVLPDALQRLDAATLARLDRDLMVLLEALGSKERGAHTPLGSGDS